MKPFEQDAAQPSMTQQPVNVEFEMWRTALLSGGGLGLTIALLAVVWLDWDAAMMWWRVASVVMVLPILLVALVGIAALVLAGTERLTHRDLDGNGVIGNDIRLIPVHARPPTLDGLDPRDLRHFVEQVGVNGDPSQANWRGKRLPSGRNCDDGTWARFVAATAKTGHLVPGGPRKRAQLVDFEVDDVLADLGLTNGDVTDTD